MDEKEKIKQFEEKWFQKWVKPRGLHYQVPIKKYLVTGALYKFNPNNETIFAIMSEDYEIGTNPQWFTINIAEEDLHKLDEDFELLL